MLQILVNVNEHMHVEVYPTYTKGYPNGNDPCYTKIFFGRGNINFRKNSTYFILYTQHPRAETYDVFHVYNLLSIIT
jgi:hypothetical protein